MRQVNAVLLMNMEPPNGNHIERLATLDFLIEHESLQQRLQGCGSFHATPPVQSPTTG